MAGGQLLTLGLKKGASLLGAAGVATSIAPSTAEAANPVATIVNRTKQLLETAPKQVKALHEKALKGDVKAEAQVKQYLKGKSSAHEADALYRGEPDPYKPILNEPRFSEITPESYDSPGYEEVSYGIPSYLKTDIGANQTDHWRNDAGTHVRRIVTPGESVRVLEVQSDLVNKSLVAGEKPFKHNVNWEADTINRQFVDAANANAPVIDFLISDEGKRMARSANVQKRYDGPLKASITKQAKKIGATVEEVRLGDVVTKSKIDKLLDSSDPKHLEFVSRIIKQAKADLGDVPEWMLTRITPNTLLHLHGPKDPGWAKAISGFSDTKAQETYLRVKLPLTATGAVAAFSVPAFAEETNQEQAMPQDITTKVQGLLGQGTSPQLVREGLASRFDEAKVNELMMSALEPKIKALRDNGTSEELIAQALEAQGFPPQQAQPGVPQQTQPDTLQQPQPDTLQQPNAPQTQPSGSFGEAALNFAGQSPAILAATSLGVAANALYTKHMADYEKANPKPIVVDGQSSDTTISKLKTLRFSYANMGNELLGATGLSPASKVKAATVKAETNQIIAQELTKRGFDVQGVNDYGDVAILDPETGKTTEYSDDMLDSLLASKFEIGNAITGGIVGARTGASMFAGGPVAGAIGTVVGGIIGSAAGAITGRGTDVYLNARDLNYEMSTAETLAKMKDAGVADLAIGLAGTSALALVKGTAGKATGRGLSRAWDLFVAGNKQGAADTVMDVFSLTPTQAIAEITKWEKLTGQKVLSEQTRETGKISISDAQGAIRALTETIPGAENVIARATIESKTGGIELAKRINTRAKGIAAEANKLTNENIDVVMKDKLDSYVTETKDVFEQTKQLGTSLMEDTPYQFVFKDTALAPAMLADIKGIHNSALRKDFYHYMERIGELGGGAKPTPAGLTKELAPQHRAAVLTQAQAKRARLEAARATKAKALEKAKLLKTSRGQANAKARAEKAFKDTRATIETEHLAKTEALRVKYSPDTAAPSDVAPNELRGFNNLLELRKTINELRSDSRFTAHTNVVQLKASLASVDKEITKAALEHMPEGATWLKHWKAANTEYSNMKTLQQNVLYKALASPRVNSEKAVNAVMDSLSYADPSTFMQVMGKLEPQTRKSVEGSVLDALIKKHTIGDDAGNQATSFHRLAADLEKMAFTQPEAQAVKRTVGAMAEVFKNDAHLLSAVGNIPLPKFQAYLTADPVVRAKFEIASTLFNEIKSRVPFSNNAGRAALVKNLGKILDNPVDAKTTKAILDALPDDPQLKTALHKLAIEFAKKGQPEAYGKVPIYRVAAKGVTTKADTVIGRGVLYYTDKATADAVAKRTGHSVRTVMQLHKRIATPEDAARSLGRDLTPEELKSPAVLQRLEDQDWAGIAVDDKVLLFKGATAK